MRRVLKGHFRSITVNIFYPSNSLPHNCSSSSYKISMKFFLFACVGPGNDRTAREQVVLPLLMLLLQLLWSLRGAPFLSLLRVWFSLRAAQFLFEKTSFSNSRPGTRGTCWPLMEPVCGAPARPCNTARAGKNHMPSSRPA